MTYGFAAGNNVWNIMREKVVRSHRFDLALRWKTSPGTECTETDSAYANLLCSWFYRYSLHQRFISITRI